MTELLRCPPFWGGVPAAPRSVLGHPPGLSGVCTGVGPITSSGGAGIGLQAGRILCPLLLAVVASLCSSCSGAPHAGNAQGPPGLTPPHAGHGRGRGMPWPGRSAGSAPGQPPSPVQGWGWVLVATAVGSSCPRLLALSRLPICTHLGQTAVIA